MVAGPSTRCTIEHPLSSTKSWPVFHLINLNVIFENILFQIKGKI